MIHARHFRRFATNQRATGCFTASGNTVDNARGVFNIQFASRKIVEEKQWLSALAHQIIDAHGHQINPNCVDISGINRNTQLGADPVRGRNQDRIVVSRAFQIK